MRSVRRLLGRLVAIAGSLVLLQCGLLFDTKGLSGSAEQPDSGVDAIDAGRAIDAGGDAEADGATDAPSSGGLPINGGFETAGAGCGAPWEPFGQVFVSQVTTSRSGGHACQMCATNPGSPDYFGVSVLWAPGTWTATQFELVAYHERSSVDSGIDEVYIDLDFRGADGGTRHVSQNGVSSGAWAPIQAVGTAGPGESLVQIGLGAIGVGGPNQCITFDDAILTSTP